MKFLIRTKKARAVRVALACAFSVALFAGEDEVFPEIYPAAPVGARLTPPVPKEPRFNGADTFGARFGCEVIFRVPVSGSRPMKFSAKGVPAGVNFDAERGIFRGTPRARGVYKISIRAENVHGNAEKIYTLDAREGKIFAPPMGWNSWYVYSEAVSAEKIALAAENMERTGLADFGWNIVAIDDCWQGVRGGKFGAIQPNARFPDMKKLCADVHARGLKIGIYSTPWISTYAGFIGGSAPTPNGDYSSVALPENRRLQPTQFFGRWPGLHTLKLDRVGAHWFFDADARQWAEWGFDWVKADWKPNDVPTAKRIAKTIDASGRNIILSLSNAAPFDAMPELSKYANLTRTTGDISDTWASVSSIGFSQERWQKFLTPSHFPDPDMLQVGATGTPNRFNETARPTRLAPDEQYAQVSLWALLRAPLMLSCDLGTLDDFTLGLLCNAEIVRLNQCGVREGVPAKIIFRENGDGGLCIWRRGNVFGFFNLSNEKRTFSVPRERLGVAGTGAGEIFDLWSHARFSFPKNRAALNLEINAHGVRLLEISVPARERSRDKKE